MRTRQTVLLIFGILGTVVTLVLLAIGGPLLWAHATQRDADGFYTLPSERLASPTYAITSEPVEVFADLHGARWDRMADRFGTVRVTTGDRDGRSVFVGVARTSNVTAYLGAVPYDTVSDLYGGRSGNRRHDGAGALPGTPAEQTFWVASAEGAGRQTLTWDIRQGDWTLVVMNSDGTPGVDVSVRSGLRTDALLPVAGWFLGAAVVSALLAAGLLAGAVAGTTHEPGPARATVPAGTYPVRVDARLDQPLNRGLWLVKWLLAIPHFVVLAFLWLAFALLSVVAWVSILLTGRYPKGIFAFNVGVLRWHWRVVYYAMTLGTDRYPPFTLGPAPDYPATLSVAYPERLSRPLVLVKSWLLALPHYLVLVLFGGAGWSASNGDWSWAFDLGLIGVLALVAGVTLTITGSYPRTVYDFVLGMQRWTFRVVAYAALMRDEYPPFRLDSGGTDPGSLPVFPPSPPAPTSPAETDELARI